eukprot:UN31560
MKIEKDPFSPIQQANIKKVQSRINPKTTLKKNILGNISYFNDNTLNSYYEYENIIKALCNKTSDVLVENKETKEKNTESVLNGMTDLYNFIMNMIT